MNRNQKNPGNMNYFERCSQPTPKFFKTIRTIGLILAAAGGAIMAAPFVLPVALITASSYMILAGSIATAVS